MAKKAKKRTPKLPPGMGIGQVPSDVKQVSFTLETQPDYEKVVRETREDLVRLREELTEAARHQSLQVRDPDHAMTVVRLLQFSHRADVVLMRMGVSETLGGLVTKIDGKEVKRGRKRPKA